MSAIQPHRVSSFFIAQQTPQASPPEQATASVSTSPILSASPRTTPGTSLREQAHRIKRDAAGTHATQRRFPSIPVATAADATAQKNLVQWLNTGAPKDKPIPQNASIAPFIEQYNEATNDSALQAWLKAKGFKASTVRVFSDSVSGIVVRDGKDVFQRFTTTDGSGWWEVSARLSALQKILSPSDLGLPVTQGTLPRDVILDFYGVKPPRNEKAAPQLGRQLRRDGWPEISQAQREQWAQQFKQLQQVREDNAIRARLVGQLQPLIKDKKDDEPLSLNEQAVVVAPGSSLDQRSKQPRKQFNDFLASPTFKAFLEKIGFDTQGAEFRLSQGELQRRAPQGQWVSLQAYFDDEVTKVSAAGTADEQQAARDMNAGFQRLVAMSANTGNALYASRAYDARQVLAFYGADTLETVGQLRAALAWFNTRLPSPPLAGNYAGMTPYAPTPGALTDSDQQVIKGASPQVVALLERFPTVRFDGQAYPDADQHLAAFFDSPQAIAKAEEIAKSLKLYSVVDGQPLSRAERHELLATALKLSVRAPVPGAPGNVAGYALYQPGNLGRTLKAVRGDVEKHLESLGVDAAFSPLMAHLFMAQAAPEMLIKADSGVQAESAQLLNQDPQNVKMGSTAWLEMRQGCAIADALSGPGSSRSMNFNQVMALSRLEASGPTQETLIKNLAAQPLLDWAVMVGVFPSTSDGQYSAGDYKAAAQAFTERENQTRDAFQALTREPPTQTSILLQQLALLFPEMTEEELRGFKLEEDTDVPYDPRQHAHLETRQPFLTDVILTEQVEGDPLLTADRWLNQKKYKFIHPKISQATFDERIARLPKIAPLVAPAVDTYIADMRAAQATALKLMIAQLPLEDRKALELGKIEFFSVREATGDDLDDDRGADSKVASHTGKHGLLIRYEHRALEPEFGYYEVFPGSMQMIRRPDLPYKLSLDGQVEEGRKPFGPFAYAQTKFRKGTPQPLDYQAYSNGSSPRPGTTSTVIIEQMGTELPGTPLPAKADSAIERVPNTFISTKTSRMVDALMAHTFDGNRDALLEHANQPTKLHSRRTYPFTSGKNIFTAANARMMLSLIPFVGAIADLVDGKVADGLKGLLIDFVSLAVTGGLAGARKFLKGMKQLLPFNGKPFSMTGLKDAGGFFLSLFNPLDGTNGVLKSGPRLINAMKKVMKGEMAHVGSNIYMPTTAFEKCRWLMGARNTLLPESGQSASQFPGSRLGTSQNREIYAVQKDDLWYGISPNTCQPEGAPLGDFVPQAA